MCIHEEIAICIIVFKTLLFLLEFRCLRMCSGIESKELVLTLQNRGDAVVAHIEKIF